MSLTLIQRRNNVVYPVGYLLVMISKVYHDYRGRGAIDIVRDFGGWSRILHIFVMGVCNGGFRQNRFILKLFKLSSYTNINFATILTRSILNRKKHLTSFKRFVFYRHIKPKPVCS